MAPTGPPPRRCAGRWTRSRSPAPIVIGEGERDEAPMLYIGEQVGRPGGGDGDAPEIDIAVDPLEGTNLVAHGQAGAITVLAASERGGLLHAPDTYMEKLCVGPGRRRQGGHHARAHGEHPPDRRGAAAASVSDITVVILERPRHEALIAEVRAAGRPDQADQRRRPVGGDLVRRLGHRRPRGHGHRRRAGGRDHRGRAALPRRRDPGPLPLPQRRGARARRADGPRRRRARVYRTDDLASGENLVFAATGVTAGRPAPGRPLLRRRRPDALAGDGLPDQAGPLRRHGPHVRPRAARRASGCRAGAGAAADGADAATASERRSARACTACSVR